VHLDFVNTTHPPDFVALYCLRADPRGGGASVVATVDAVHSLDADDLEVLRQPVFRDGSVYDLRHVGEDINPFAVWAPGSTHPLRWTGKLLQGTNDTRAHKALARLARALDNASVEVALRPGQMLVVSQRRAVHGRRALAPGQETLGVHERRLLMHAFGRLRE